MKDTQSCANPWCNNKFKTLNKHQKYCSKECAIFMHKRQKHKCHIKDEHYICENPNCQKEHNGSYGSGRFCSKKCKDEYIASTKIGVKTSKIKTHLKKLHRNNRSPHGTWKCEKCNLIFETRSKLKEHTYKCIQYVNISSDNFYTCPFCCKHFKKRMAVIGHLRSCPKHPEKEKHDLQHKQTGEKVHQQYLSGERVSSWKGKHHTAKARENMRKAACEYLKLNNATPCRYNKSSISILESIAKEHGWNIQHAENGGEFYTGIGYWLDAYDKEKNIALEYDEPKHYIDAQNNILRQKDIDRQNEIIEHLHCEYWRFNELTQKLWKVNS